MLSRKFHVLLQHTHTHKHTTILWLSGFCPGRPGWDSTRREREWHLLLSTIISYLLPPSITIHGILSVQFTCLTVFFHNLSKFYLVYLLALHPPLHTPCPYHCNLYFCCSKIMSSNPSLSLNPLLGTLSCSLTPNIYLTILISACWSATSFSFLMGQISLPCNILLHTQLLYNLPLIINDISLLVSNGTNCLNLFHPIQIMVSTATSASPSTLNKSPKITKLIQ